MNNTKNECADCNVCCWIFNIKSLNKSKDIICQHYDSTVGCKINNSKPIECKLFNCLFIQSNNDVSFRPDKLGVVFEKNKDNFLVGTICTDELDYYQLAKYINLLNQQEFSVMIIKNDYISPNYFIATNHNKKTIIDYGKQYLKLIKHTN